MYANVKDRNSSNNILMKSIVFISICVIYAFSNITELSVLIQCVFVGITIVNILVYKKMRISIHFIWMLLFIGWALFATLFSDYSTESLTETLNLTLKLLFYTALIVFINNEEKFNFVLKSLVFSGMILILRVIILTPTSDWGTNRLGSSLDVNPNALGISLSFIAIVSVYLGIKTKNKKYYLLAVLFSLFGFLTGSKKVLFAIFGGVFLLYYLKTTNKFKKILVLLSVIIGGWLIYIIMMNVPFLYEVIGSRIENVILFTESGEVDKSTLHRSIMIQEAWNLFKENPITGIGLENFKMYSFFETYTHNNYMEVLVSTGIVGLIIYYSFLILMFFYAIYHKNNKDYNLIITVITVILILDIANVSYRQLMTQVMIVLCVSRILMLRRAKGYD